MKLQEIHEVEQGIRPPENLKMTLEEFLEHDVAGYEYIEDDTLTGENVTPGFTCPAAHLFE